MAEIRHYINNQLINGPRNWQELTISSDWVGTKQSATINIDTLEFVGDDAALVNGLVFAGLNGGTGIFEGVPYQIEIGSVMNSPFQFDGFLDLTSVRVIDCDKIEVSLKKLNGVDWLESVADGFSFRYLFDKNQISTSDFIRVPYVINYIPDTVQLLILSMSTFMMTKELIENIKAIAEQVERIINASTPVTGVSVGVGAGVVTAWDVGDFVAAALSLAAQIAYTIGIVIAIIELGKQIIEQLLPKKRYHLGSSIKTLFEKGCEHLGLALKSTLLDSISDWVLIPSKSHKGGKKPTGFVGTFIETGLPENPDGYDTFGDLIRLFLPWFNADYKINNGVFELERADYWDSSSAYVMPDVFGDQETLSNPYTLNTDDFNANYNINYSYDTQDQNTLDNQTGRVFQAITEPITVTDKSLLNMKGLTEIQIPVTLSVRKNELTVVEKIIKGFATTVDFLTGQLGKPANLSGSINSRVGALNLSNHLTSSPKVVVMQGSNLKSDQRGLTGANTIWANYHFINSFVEINGKHDQYYRFDSKVPFCLQDFTILTDNNRMTTVDGESGEVETMVFNVWENSALISYRINRKYTNNLKIRIL